MPVSLPRKLFMSHSYGDADACQQLIRSLPEAVEPVVFDPVRVAPDQFVSDLLLKSILDCDGLVYLTGGHSKDSFWVAFERDYALRSGKQVFAADNVTLAINGDSSTALDLAAFASYQRNDRDRVHEVIDYLRKERFFDIWDDRELLRGGDLWEKEIEESLESRLKRGGYAVFFWSQSASESTEVREELERASEHVHEFNFNDRVLFALLEDCPLPMSWRIFVDPAVQLYGDDQRSATNRLDDLVVRLYWLIYRNERQKFTSSSPDDTK